MKINTEDKKRSPKSLWGVGKEEYKKFGSYNLKRSTFWKTTVFGILLTIVVILPFALILTQFMKVYYYNPIIKVIGLLIAWFLLLVSNGLSNFFTVKITKNYILDDERLRSFNSFAIGFYNTFNPGFMIFTFLILLVLSTGMI